MDYDAVLLEWKSRDQDGLETTRQIRSLCGNSLPVLIFSAYDWNDIEQEAQEAGVNGFLQKPVFISTLIRGLQYYVLGAQQEADSVEKGGTSSLKEKRLLLVEDNVLNQEVTKELLNDLGVLLDIACDGKAGVEAFGTVGDRLL